MLNAFTQTEKKRKDEAQYAPFRIGQMNNPTPLDKKKKNKNLNMQQKVQRLRVYCSAFDIFFKSSGFSFFGSHSWHNPEWKTRAPNHRF